MTIDSNVRPFLECDSKAMTIDYSLCRYECYTIGKWTVKVLSSKGYTRSFVFKK